MIEPMMEALIDAAGEDATSWQAQLQALTDRNAITDLISRLGLWLDDKQFDDARSIFTDDASVDTVAGTVQGIELVAAQARRSHTAFERTQHVITNLLIELHGHRASIRANLIAVFVHHADVPKLHFDVGERYCMQAIRTSLGWRLKSIAITPLWTAGSRHGN